MTLDLCHSDALLVTVVKIFIVSVKSIQPILLDLMRKTFGAVKQALI